MGIVSQEHVRSRCLQILAIVTLAAASVRGTDELMGLRAVPDGTVQDCNQNGIEDSVELGIIAFAPPRPLDVTGFPLAIATEDLDHDGRFEFVTINASNQGLSVTVHRQNGNLITEALLAAAPRALALADVDRSNGPDVVTVHPQDGSVTVLYNDGLAGLIGRRSHKVGRGPEALTVADIDDDGAPDIITANRFSHDVTVLFGSDEDGLPFQRRLDLAVGPTAEPMALVAVDLDEDGHLDVATANGAGASVTVLFQEAAAGGGNPLFLRPHLLTLGDGTHPIGLVAGDVDSDGRVDLVTADMESNTVTVLVNDGPGKRTFTRRSFSGGAFPRDVLAVDFEGDGDLDIATLNSDSQDIVVHVNDGRGGLSRTVCVSGVRRRLAFAVTDMDDDGDLDLVTADGGAGTISVLTNTSLRAIAPDRNQNGVPDTCDPRFRRGDCNGDRNPGELADALFLLNYSFLGGLPPGCVAACDIDGNGRVGGGVDDAVYLLNYSFLGGQAPPPPLTVCGVGTPADEALGCDQPACP